MTRRRPARKGEALTRTEQRIAELAAGGHTNRVIAAQLYVASSTVEQHLTRVYRKLGITRRHELRTIYLPLRGMRQEPGARGSRSR